MSNLPVEIDREATVPFHLKLFYKVGSFHRPEEFIPNSDLPPQYLELSTWPSCTLRELSHLLSTSLPSLLPDPAIGTRLSFRLVFPDMRNASSSGPGRYMSKDIGSIVIGDGGLGLLSEEDEGKAGLGTAGEPDKTLQDARFIIGDYVACAISYPLGNGDVAPPLGGQGIGLGMGRGFGGERRGGGDFGRGAFGGRENGFPNSGGFRGRGGQRGGGFGQGLGMTDGLPRGEWRRGEAVPEGPSGRGRGGYGGRGAGFGGGRY